MAIFNSESVFYHFKIFKFKASYHNVVCNKKNHQRELMVLNIIIKNN